MSKSFNLSNGRIQRHLPEKGDSVILAHLFGAPGNGRKNDRLELAAGADEARHVLNDAEHLQVHLLAEVQLFSDVQKRHLLGCCDDHRSVNTYGLTL